jgi:hypothetical protein
MGGRESWWGYGEGDRESGKGEERAGRRKREL